MPDNLDGDLSLRLLWVDRAFGLATQLVKWAGILGVVYLISTMVSALAGKTTLADIAIQFLTASHAREWTSYGITGAAIVWAILERRLRKSTGRQLSRRLKVIENRLDPDRSSSELTETGETRPEDR